MITWWKLYLRKSQNEKECCFQKSTFSIVVIAESLWLELYFFAIERVAHLKRPTEKAAEKFSRELFLVFLLWFEWCYALKKLKILKNCDNNEKNSKFENHVVYCIRNFNCWFPGILMLRAYFIYMTCKQQKILYNISGCNLISLIYVEDEIFSDWVEETNISLSNYRVIEFQMKQVTFCFVIALIISRVQVLEKCDYK